MQIERGTLNTLLVNARPTLTPSRWLLWFRDPERNASVYCLCSALVAGSPTLIRFEETDTPTALNGQVKLSPPGNWTLKIYEQSSTTNLNPANATRLVEERAVFVVGAVEPESGWSGTECPPCSGDDCEDGTVILVDSEGTELDSVTVASAGEASMTAPDVTVRQTDGNTGITVGSAPAGGTYLLPETVIRYNDGSGVVTTQTYNTLGSDPNITPDVTVPARALKDSDDNPIGSTVITLADLLDNTVPNCPECPPCDPLTVTLAGVEIVNEADPCGVDVALTCADLVDAVVVEGAGTDAANGLYVRSGEDNGQPEYTSASNYRIHYEYFGIDDIRWSIDDDITDSLYSADSGVNLFDRTWSVLNGSGPVPTVSQATIGDICGGGDCPPCDNVTVQLQDSAASPIGAPDVYPAGTVTTKTAPDGSVTINNSVPTTLHTVAVRSNGTATQVIADSTAVIKNLNGTTIKTEAIPAAVSENITAPIPLKFALAAGDDTSITWTVSDDEAGTYGTYTQDGSSGTLTYSLNGGAFVALSGAIALAVGNTIAVRRTAFTSAGFIRWAP